MRSKGCTCGLSDSGSISRSSWVTTLRRTMANDARQKIAPADVSELIVAVRAQHQRAFDLAHDVGAAGEYLRRQPRRPRAATSQAMEFLARQAHPTFGSVQILAERA